GGLGGPGGNVSGFQNFEPAMGGKWLGVLKEAAPNMRRAAVLFGSDSVATFASQPDGGLIITSHPSVPQNRALIILSAARHRLPAVYPFRYFATEGGLMAYGPDQIDQWRGAATYADRILRGEKPGELPVQTPAKYELVINLKAANVIGLNIAPGLPLRADEVIE